MVSNAFYRNYKWRLDLDFGVYGQQLLKTLDSLMWAYVSWSKINYADERQTLRNHECAKIGIVGDYDATFCGGPI